VNSVSIGSLPPDRSHLRLLPKAVTPSRWSFVTSVNYLCRFGYLQAPGSTGPEAAADVRQGEPR
jgi:hypothetical protein